MTWNDLKKSAGSFRPAYWYDDFLPISTRRLILQMLFGAAFIALFFALELVTQGTGWLLSVFYLALAAISVLAPFELYYNSLRYGELADGLTFELGTIVRDTDETDITVGFAGSKYGRMILLRLGIQEEAWTQFVSSRASRLTGASLVLPDERITLTLYADSIFNCDKEFKDFLFRTGVLEADWTGAVGWIERDDAVRKQKEQWWTRRSLEKIQGIGKAWGYGQVWLLEKYGSEFAVSHDLSGIDINGSYHRKEVDELENVLARASEANAIVVGEEAAGMTDIVARLAKRIQQGTAHPAVEGRHVYLLDHNALIAATGEKNKFELEVMRIMRQSIRSGNVILVISDLPGFMASAQSIGSDIVSILDPYLASNSIQIVALCDTMNFHQTIERNAVLVERFEKIAVIGGTNEETMRLLEDKVEEFERRYGVFFTYQALGAVAESADRYFPSGVMPDKAIDLLVEAIPSMTSRGKTYIGKQDILDLVEQKTGIPVSGIKDEERDKLSRLEQILHERIVGQEIAVDAIANAMRRARSGVSNPNRPMGSFLFIGPTGVGKTETTKALAEVFFNDEARIQRLDMSEYSGDDAVTRLIGSFQSGKAGTLVTMLKEKPYGVLLLDEFEKASKEVHNLFLQVLDEGIFSDMMGKKVNARNLIIIATSNAGSQHIWELSQQGRNIADAKDIIVDDIIKNAIFKPELLNRFDGVILFHPLKQEHLEGVARKMLKGLQSRLEERKINLVVNDALVKFLVGQGSDPKFGARPLNRAIQEKVEGAIAQKLIRGEVQPGAEIVLTEADLGVVKAPQSAP